MIDKVALTYSPMRELCNVVQAFTSDYHKLVAKTRASSGWVGETDARTATGTPTFADIAPPMGELYANPQATQAVIDDASFAFDSWIAGEIGEIFGEAEATGFLTGTGSNQPLGILTAPFVATADASRAFGSYEYIATGVSGDFAASDKADALISLMFQLRAGYRKNAKWLMAPSTLKIVRQFKDQYGRYLIEPNVQAGNPPTLLGYPLYESEDMPSVAANSLSVLFGDFNRGYEIVDRTPIRMIRDPFSNKPFVGFYTTKRTSGAPTNTQAIKALKFAAS